MKHNPLPKIAEVNHSMYLKPMTPDEVREIFDHVDNKYSSGDDDISNILI